MSRQVNPIKHIKIKKALLQGKSGSQALQEAGYTEATANHHLKEISVYNRVVEEIKEDFRKGGGVTVEKVITDLEAIQRLAIVKKDYSSAKECAIWKGKHLAMFTDRSEVHSTADINLRERLTKLTHILETSGRIGNLLKENHCKPLEPVMVDNSGKDKIYCKPSTPTEVDNENHCKPISPSKVDNTLPQDITNIKQDNAKQDNATIKQDITETEKETAGGGREEREKMEEPPSATSPILKVIPSITGSSLESAPQLSLIGSQLRDTQITQAYASGVKVKELALKYGISAPRVYQILKRGS